MAPTSYTFTYPPLPTLTAGSNGQVPPRLVKPDQPVEVLASCHSAPVAVRK